MNEPIPLDEAADTVRDCLGFAGDNSSPHVVVKTTPVEGQPTQFIVEMARWKNFHYERPQQFKVTIEPMNKGAPTPK